MPRLPNNPDRDFSASQSEDDINADIAEFFASRPLGIVELFADPIVRMRIGSSHAHHHGGSLDAQFLGAIPGPKGSGTSFPRWAFFPAERFSVDNEWRCNMFKSLDIQKDMEVVGLDGKHVGTVDHLETADRIILSKDDPKAGGRRHLISIDWVDYVDQKVHLNKPSTKATSEWQAAA
jgi:hypothetical protein